MIKGLSITKNSEREITAVLPLKPQNNSSSIEYNNYIRTCIGFITDSALANNLYLQIYKLELQNIIVFNIKGNEENICNLIKSFN